LANSIPTATDVFDSRILVMMPDPMTGGSGAPSVKAMDDYLVGPSIARIETDDEHPGCSSRVCYGITHTTGQAIPGGSRLRLQIRGTVNQPSVQTASVFYVAAELRDIQQGVYSVINAGTFESGFLTQRGGISLPAGKRLLSDNYLTYNDSARYTLYFYMAYYIPLAGSLRVLLPTEVEITSNPYTDLATDTGLQAPLDQEASYGRMAVYD
jgi:hypothetical protein